MHERFWNMATNTTNVLVLVGVAITVVAVCHVSSHIYRHGLVNAWQKSVARKGSWTARLYHVYAMWSKSVADHDTEISEETRGRIIRNVYGKYNRRTGEKHNSQGKYHVRVAGKPKVAAVYDSLRFSYSICLEALDGDVHGLFCQQHVAEDNPSLACLDFDEVLQLRKTQRKEMTSHHLCCHLDVTERTSGKFVGTASFTNISTAEKIQSTPTTSSSSASSPSSSSSSSSSPPQSSSSSSSPTFTMVVGHEWIEKGACPEIAKTAHEYVREIFAQQKNNAKNDDNKPPPTTSTTTSTT